MTISIHALREERDKYVAITKSKTIFISIHALREERDRLRYLFAVPLQIISIHALREERDHLDHSPFYDVFDDFNPRAPRGRKRTRLNSSQDEGSS